MEWGYVTNFASLWGLGTSFTFLGDFFFKFSALIDFNSTEDKILSVILSLFMYCLRYLLCLCQLVSQVQHACIVHSDGSSFLRRKPLNTYLILIYLIDFLVFISMSLCDSLFADTYFGDRREMFLFVIFYYFNYLQLQYYAYIYHLLLIFSLHVCLMYRCKKILYYRWLFWNFVMIWNVPKTAFAWRRCLVHAVY